MRGVDDTASEISLVQVVDRLDTVNLIVEPEQDLSLFHFQRDGLYRAKLFLTLKADIFFELFNPVSGLPIVSNASSNLLCLCDTHSL